ncbi:MAG: hypothetical protein JXR91_06325 [Deltaproteobacteria bacterium]|nr:hypothetical protein [Deltaproteobacteria bacterium]
MPEEKTCPVCKKEIPALAVRCRHCGFKLPHKNEGEPFSPKMTQPMRTITMNQARQTKSTAPPKAVYENLETKKKNRTLPPTPRPGIKAKPATAAKPSLPKVKNSAPISKSVLTDGDWVPEIEDVSGLIELGNDTTSEISLSEISTVSQENITDDAPLDKKAAAKKYLFTLWATFGVTALDFIKNNFKKYYKKISILFIEKKPLVESFLKSRPVEKISDRVNLKNPKVNSFLKFVLQKTAWWHLFLIGCLILISPVLLPSGSDQHKKNTLDKDKKVETVIKNQSTDRKNKYSKKNESAAKALKTDNSDQFKIAEPLPNCHPLVSMPDFEYKILIQQIFEANQAPGFCKLFGKTFNEIKDSVKEFKIYDSEALDSLKGGRVLELYPGGIKDRTKNYINFIFYDNKLFKITVNYFTGTESLDLDSMEDLSGSKIEKSGNNGLTLKDGDVLLEISNYRNSRSFMESLTFLSLSMSDSINLELQKYSAALIKLSLADKLFNNGKYDSAAAEYKKALTVNPFAFSAYNGLAEISLKKGDVNKALGFIENIGSAVADNRVKAKTSYILSRIKLQQNDKKGSIEKLNESIADDPAATLYSLSLKELKSNNYSVERVAEVAAMMSCLNHLNKSSNTVLFENNFENSTSFFAALEKSKMDVNFEKLKKRFIKNHCK